jgi:hypothetical protein
MFSAELLVCFKTSATILLTVDCLILFKVVKYILLLGQNCLKKTTFNREKEVKRNWVESKKRRHPLPFGGMGKVEIKNK